MRKVKLYTLLLLLTVIWVTVPFIVSSEAVVDQLPELATVPVTDQIEWPTKGGPSYKHPKMDSSLAELAEEFRDNRQNSMNIQVHIVTSSELRGDVVSLVEDAGGEVTKIDFDNNVIQAWVPIGSLDEIAQSDCVYYIRRPARMVEAGDFEAGSFTTEGLDAMNAKAWHDNGYLGKNVKVGIIDPGFSGYKSLLGTELPNSVTVKNFVDHETDAQVDGGGVHGTACAEIIHDIAPEAQLFFAKAKTTLDDKDAVKWLEECGVNIISCSWGLLSGPGDGNGPLTKAVNRARQKGILWVNAAGNERLVHWNGMFSDTDGDGAQNFDTPAHNLDYFGPGTGDGRVYVIPAGVNIQVSLKWSDWQPPVDQDYDLLLLKFDLDEGKWVTVAKSENLQNGQPGQTPTEYINYTTKGDRAPYGVAIIHYRGSREVNLDLVAWIQGNIRLESYVPSHSVSHPADCQEVMAVGAVGSQAPYDQEPYSSEGPTYGPGGVLTGGYIKPDISAYTGVSTASYGSRYFGGTSASAPHVAGAAALVLSAYPNYTVDQLESFLEQNAVDKGDPGEDNQYGYGRLWLPPPPPPDGDGCIIPSPRLEVRTTGKRVVLSWNSVSDANGYELYYAPFPKGDYVGIDVGNQTILSGDLWEGASFHVAVKAYNSSHSCISKFSNIEYFVVGWNGQLANGAPVPRRANQNIHESFSYGPFGICTSHEMGVDIQNLGSSGYVFLRANDQLSGVSYSEVFYMQEGELITAWIGVPCYGISEISWEMRAATAGDTSDGRVTIERSTQ